MLNSPVFANRPHKEIAFIGGDFRNKITVYRLDSDLRGPQVDESFVEGAKTSVGFSWIGCQLNPPIFRVSRVNSAFF